MNPKTIQKVALALQMMQLDGNGEPKDTEIAKASGISRKTIQRHKQIIKAIKFALDNKRSYKVCMLATFQ